jgi:glycosyltransferase involved in cell wall biosynthesis
MRILFLTQILPYPPNAGPRVKTWHVLRYLYECGHQVTLVTFLRPEEAPYVSDVEAICEAVYTIPIHRSRLADLGYWLRSHLSGRPFLIERDDLPALRQTVRRLLAQEAFAVVHADQLTMTQFALEAKADAGKHQVSKQPFIIFDAHNATWSIWKRMRENAAWFLKPLYRLEESRIKRYEGMLVTEFDHTMVVIDPDADLLLAGLSPAQREVAAVKISAIPIAVDTRILQPVERVAASRNILTLGSLNYPPNADGIRWFMRDIFPLVRAAMPEVTLTVIGKNPPPDFHVMAAAADSKITVTGYVDDLDPYMAAAALLVVPVRAGSGMRVRLLEAFARAMPAVTTTIGMEGIAAEDETHLLIADTEQDFAAATVRLLRDAELQACLAKNGRQLAESSYDWRVVLGKMDAIFTEAEAAHG